MTLICELKRENVCSREEIGMKSNRVKYLFLLVFISVFQFRLSESYSQDCPETHPIVDRIILIVSGRGSECDRQKRPQSAIWSAEDQLHWNIYGTRPNGPQNPNSLKSRCESGGGVLILGQKDYRPAERRCNEEMEYGAYSHHQSQIVTCCWQNNEPQLITNPTHLLNKINIGRDGKPLSKEEADCLVYGMHGIFSYDYSVQEEGTTCTAATDNTDSTYQNLLKENSKDCTVKKGTFLHFNDYASARCFKGGGIYKGLHSGTMLCCKRRAPEEQRVPIDQALVK